MTISNDMRIIHTKVYLVILLNTIYIFTAFLLDESFNDEHLIRVKAFKIVTSFAQKNAMYI